MVVRAGVDRRSEQGIDMYGPREGMMIDHAEIGRHILLVPIKRLQQELEPAFLGLGLVLLQFSHALGTLRQLKHIPNDYNNQVI